MTPSRAACLICSILAVSRKIRIGFSLLIRLERQRGLGAFAQYAPGHADEVPEQGVGPARPRPELGVELAPHHPGGVGHFADLDQRVIRGNAAVNQPRILEWLAVV